MRKIFFLFFPLLIASSCGNTEKTDEVAATEMDDPIIAGRNAAKAFINKEWKDTFELQSYLLDAKSKQSIYLINGETDKAEKFDSAFVSTIKTVRPELAREIFGQ